MTNEELIKELQSDRERIPRKFINDSITLIESQAKDIVKLQTKLTYAEDAATKGDLARQTVGGMEMQIAELKSQKRKLTIVLKQCIEEFGELSGPPLSRRVKLILEAKALLNETRNKS